MAIPEHCGHGRRGEKTYQRQDDGSETISEHDVVERREVDGKVFEETRRRKFKPLADDMPWVVEEWGKHQAGSGS
jgi:hypothetical protein